MVKQLSGGVYMVGGQQEASVVSFSSDRTASSRSKGGKDKIWARWFNSQNGDDIDKEPQILLDLAKNNNLQMPLLNTNVDFCIGTGIGLFRRTIVDDKTKLQPVEDPIIQEWLDRNQVDEVMNKLATDFYYTGNFFLEGVLQRDMQVASVRHQHPTDCRAELINPNTGRIEHYYLGDFMSGKAKYDADAPLDPKKSTVKKVRSFNADSPGAKFIWHGKQYYPGQKYYGIPQWWGVKTWIRLSNQIPVFHLSGLTKGYNIRWHIKIPLSYFEQFPEKDREAEEDSILAELDALLSGADNHGKAFISRFSDDKKYPEWKIEPLKGELYDEAYKDIFSHSNTALSSANGVDPSLAGYDTTGKLSSGSEKKNSYNIHVALKTPRPRQILFKWLYDVARINKWDTSISFSFKDFEIMTTDANPTGVQNTVAA